MSIAFSRLYLQSGLVVSVSCAFREQSESQPVVGANSRSVPDCQTWLDVFHLPIPWDHVLTGLELFRAVGDDRTLKGLILDRRVSSAP